MLERNSWYNLNFNWLQGRKELNRNNTDFLINRNINSVNYRSVDICASVAIHCEGYRLFGVTQYTVADI